MKVFYLFIVLLWSFGMMLYSQDAQSAIPQNSTSQFTWHTEESFHAHGSTIQINTPNNAEEEDEVNDEDEFKLKCFFSKKDTPFIPINFKEGLVSIHPKLRLLKPYLKPQFTPPDHTLIVKIH
ncbi:MAG: hypothetical protein HQ448_12115 [Cytophagales bacterium]|nr:hypothetical protein [Cytophagales bacterium]